MTDNKAQLKRVLEGLPTLSSRQFVFPRKLGVSRTAERGTEGVADASCLDEGGRRPWYWRVWDDAADVGFWLVSTRTGDRVLFVHARDEWNEEGDLVAQRFVSYGHEPELQVTVFND